MMIWKLGKLQRYKIEGLCLMLNCTSPCTNPFSQLHILFIVIAHFISAILIGLLPHFTKIQ